MSISPIPGRTTAPIPAATMLGYLAEGARTNHFLQSGTPATQTSGSLSTGTYTLWMDGTGSIAVAGATATITGAGTATSSTAVTFVVTVAGTVTYTVTGSPTRAQSENGAQRSSYIPTTTIAVTRNADVLTYSSAGNIDGTKGWVYAELRMPTSTGGNAYVMDVGSNRPTMFIDSLGVDSLYDGTATRLFSTYTFGDQSKICNTWGGASSVGAVDGAVTTYGFDGDLNTGAAISIGCSNASASHVFGTIRNVRIGQRALSSAELQAITS